MKQGLLVIDVQNDYFPDGKMSLFNSEGALNKINQLEEHFLARNLPIIYIQHIKHVKNASFFEANAYGSELHSSLKIKSNSIIVEKHFPNSFYKTNLKSILYSLGIEQLIICGMMTHMCIDSTTRASKELQFNPILITDATATKDLKIGNELINANAVQRGFLAALTNFATLYSTDDFLLQ